jgi:hypothetical protein
MESDLWLRPENSAQIQEYRARTRCKSMTPRGCVSPAVKPAASQGGWFCPSTPQNETNAPVDRRVTTASGGGGGVEAEGGILRFRLWYMERFAEKWFPGFRATKRDHLKTSASPKSGFPVFGPRSATIQNQRCSFPPPRRTHSLSRTLSK